MPQASPSSPSPCHAASEDTQPKRPNRIARERGESSLQSPRPLSRGEAPRHLCSYLLYIGSTKYPGDHEWQMIHDKNRGFAGKNNDPSSVNNSTLQRREKATLCLLHPKSKLLQMPLYRYQAQTTQNNSTGISSFIIHRSFVAARFLSPAGEQHVPR